MNRKYDTDKYLPTRSLEEQRLLWFNNMRQIAEIRVDALIEKAHVKSKSRMPLTVFIRSNGFDIELMVEEENLEICNKHNDYILKLLEKREEYLEKIKQQHIKNSKIYGIQG